MHNQKAKNKLAGSSSYYIRIANWSVYVAKISDNIVGDDGTIYDWCSECLRS